MNPRPVDHGGGAWVGACAWTALRDLRLLILCLLAGCAHPVTDRMDLPAALDTPMRALQEEPRSQVTELASSYVRALAVDYEPAGRGGVSVRVVRAPMDALLRGICQEAGYTLLVAEGVDAQQAITIDLRSQDFDSAVKELAFSAGYAAILDRTAHTVTLSRQATYTYRLPPHLLQHLLMQYAVGSHAGSAAIGAAGSGGGASGAAPTSNAAPGQALAADFGVQAREQHEPEDFRRFVASLAGGPTQVSVLPDSGMVSVHGSAQDLRRVSSFIEQYVRDAGSQVELQVSLLEVSLGRQFQFGIDWSRVIGLRGLLGNGASANLQISNGQVVNSPSLTTTITNQTTTAVIKALEQFTQVQVLSQPRLIALNHSPAIIHDGTQVPYLGSVASTVTGVAGTTSNSGAVSFALDGVSLAFRPDILDQQLVQLSVIPILSTVSDFQTFSLGAGAGLTVPRQPVRQAHLQVIVESGKTVIVGGTRAVSDNGLTRGVPGTADLPFLRHLLNGYDDGRTRKELVMLIHANIIPARAYRFLVGESL
jgi:MSHA biogenesis protein MshL